MHAGLAADGTADGEATPPSPGVGSPSSYFLLVYEFERVKLSLFVDSTQRFLSCERTSSDASVSWDHLFEILLGMQVRGLDYSA